MTITSILKIASGDESWSDSIGNPVAAPIITFASNTTLEIDLRSASSDYTSNTLPVYPASMLSSVESWSLAIDTDYDRSTSPKYLLTSGITKTTSATQTLISIPLASFNTATLSAALAGNKTVTMQAELTGYDSNTNTVFVAQFPIVIRNRIYLPEAV